MDWLGLLFSLFPLAWGVLLVQEVRLARRLRLVGVEVPGRIVRQRKVSGSRGGSYTVFTIGFRTQTGQPVEVERESVWADLEFFDGDEVWLRYDPARPTSFLLLQELPNTKRYWLLVLAGVLLGVGLLAAWKVLPIASPSTR